MNRDLFASAGLVVLLSAACAPAAPTVDPAQIQASAMAAASTMIAMTQAAMPTATEVPPTPEPSPTALPTVPPLPTIALPTVEPTKSPDSCNQLLDLGEAGYPPATLKINNLTKGTVSLTIGLGSKNAFGQCGYIWYQIKPKESIIAHPPQTGAGPCYWSYAMVNDPQHPSIPGGAPPLCMNNDDKYEMDISADSMRITPP